MNHVERFRAVMDFQPVDRLAALGVGHVVGRDDRQLETTGLPAGLEGVFEIAEYFGLDPYQQFWFSTTDNTIEAVQHHVEGIVSNMDDYLRLRPKFFPDHGRAIESMRPWAQRQARGEAVVWITLEGYFWFPRTLMGFTKISLAFYDQPELLHRINQDLTDFNLKILDQVEQVCVPTFATIAEDMSYNNGPMISERHFDEFIAPYYRQLVPRLLEKNVIPLVDTDGDVTMLVPWLMREGIRGVLPLERQAGVDGMDLRRAFPRVCLVGHYDKMVMNKGEEAMRKEFERLLPLMRSGGFIPSVDHQTPPHVTLERVSAVPPAARRIHRSECEIRTCNLGRIDDEEPERREPAMKPRYRVLAVLFCWITMSDLCRRRRIGGQFRRSAGLGPALGLLVLDQRKHQQGTGSRPTWKR